MVEKGLRELWFYRVNSAIGARIVDSACVLKYQTNQ